MRHRICAIAIAFFALWGGATLAQVPDAGTPEPSLRPFNPEELATPPPEWRTPPPPPPPQPAPEHHPTTADATPATPAPAPTTGGKPTFESYSWSFVVIDPLAMAAMAYGVYGHNDGALFYGTVAYVFNGPLIHMLHGRLGHGGFSLLYRLAVPVVSLFTLGNLVGAYKCQTASCTRNQLVAVLGLGMLGAWGWDLASADEPGPPESVKFSATFGTTDRGTPTAGFGLRF